MKWSNIVTRIEFTFQCADSFQQGRIKGQAFLEQLFYFVDVFVSWPRKTLRKCIFEFIFIGDFLQKINLVTVDFNETSGR